MSRKARKGRKEKKLISELGVLGVLARGISESEGSLAPGKFAQAAEIIMDSGTKDTKVSEILFLNFVLFVSFVVSTLSH